MQALKKVLQSKYLLFSLFLLIIFISYYRINLDITSSYKGSEQEFKLKVIEKKYKDDKYTITLLGRERLISYSNDFPYDVGDIVKVKGSLTKPNKNTIPNTFNYQRYLQSRGIIWELKINEIDLIQKNSSIINQFKKMIMDQINKNKYSEYLYIFLLGDSSYFTSEKRNIYENCGLSYLISIGSLQIMMIVSLLKKIEKKLKI